MDSSDLAVGIFSGIYALYFAFLLLLCIAVIVAKWKILEKAGKAGWKILVPFYGTYVFFSTVWNSGWMFLLSFIPLVNIIVSALTMLKLAKAFGQSVGFGVGLIFLPYVFLLILAFGKFEYNGIPESIV